MTIQDPCRDADRTPQEAFDAMTVDQRIDLLVEMGIATEEEAALYRQWDDIDTRWACLSYEIAIELRSCWVRTGRWERKRKCAARDEIAREVRKPDARAMAESIKESIEELRRKMKRQ